MKLDSTGVIDINSSFVKICKRHPEAFVRALNMWFGVEQGNEKILFYYNTLFSVNCHSSLRWTDTKGNKMVSLSQNRQRGGVGRRVFCV